MTNVFFDMVSFTVFIVKSERLEVKNNLFQLLNSEPNNQKINRDNSDPHGISDYRVKHYREINGRYNHTFHFDIPMHSNVKQGYSFKENYFNLKISIFSKNKSHNFIKFEFNPAKLGEDGGFKIRAFLIKILGIKLARTLFYEARLTRLDTTIDCHSAVDKFYMYMKGFSCSEIIRGADDEIQSQICGSNRSNIRVTAYDKAEQTKQSHGLDAESVSWVRLEIVNRDLGFAMAEIREKLELQFKKLSFYRADFLADTYFDDDFLVAVQAEGLNTALSKLQRNDRKRYLRRLEHYKFDPFKLSRLTIKPGLQSLQFLKSTKYTPSVMT
ncbi:hypothetical protein C8R26_10829 [Nitrosomonas oligotropha]|uniref:Uncharacterized protein n=1 Tax=Nitrosomonas oligotropha TaxID=42354 RepID=A0A2T5I0Q5_9PROT|nr:hypothetical protein [Nitrosomonas oligotropha]PTQ77383.1 hypothetical protein C8R26_10829 [Nitrosomonas oligotropha]